MPYFVRNMLLFLVIIFGYINSSEGQLLSYGCPKGWVQHLTTCYKFVEEALVYDEADAACWHDGAKLVSVNDYQEHAFISKWLVAIDAMIQSKWFTSGYYANNAVIWEGDQSLHEGQRFWNRQPRYNEDVHRIIYAFGHDSSSELYGWLNISASVPCNYICEISRDEAANIDIISRNFDYGLGTVDVHEVKRGPNIVNQPINVVLIEGAQSVEVECAATGNPYPNFRWWSGTSFENATEVTSASHDRYTLSSGRLALQNPTSEDAGTFFCSADNDVGVVLSNSAQFIWGFLEPFSNIKPEPVRAEAFKGAKLDCAPQSFSPSVAFEWFKNQATNIFVWPSNANMFVSQSGLLYFSEVQPTDANKHYFCIVTLVNSADNTVMARANPPSRNNLGLWLELSSGSSSDNDYGPILHTHVFPNRVTVGRKIRMECIAYGGHPLFYTWRREDGRDFVPGTKLSGRNRILEIPNAPLEAEGNYICRCVRGQGNSAEKVINLVIEAKPYFPYPIRDMFVDPGMTLNWYCKAVARPQPQYTWYKNGEPLANTNTRYKVNGNTLQIQGIDKEADEGMYQCGATNVYGTTFSAGQLKVLSFAPNFDKFPLPPLTLAPIGGNVTIKCDVEAAPVPQVSWLKNGANLNLLPGDVSGRLGMTVRFELVITGVQSSDGGQYLCEASNMNGDARNRTILQIMQGISITMPPQSTTVNVNRTAFMYCQATYDQNSYDLTYLWKFNGHLIDYKLNSEYVSGSQSGIDGLYITNAQYKNAGLYECVAQTSLFAVTRAALLDVDGPPGPPAGVYADDDSINTVSARLVWTVGLGINHGDPITYYDIEAESNYHPDVWVIVASDIPDFAAKNLATQTAKREDQRAALVQNLVPNTSYRFRVRAANNYGRGQEASAPSTRIKIDAAAPTLYPKQVGGGGGSVGTLTITWQPLDVAEYCGPGLGYMVYWKEEGSERDWIENEATDDNALNDGMFTVTVGPDNFYKRYQVMIKAFNNLGSGPNSEVVLIYSAMGMPVSVPILDDPEGVNSTSMIVWWIPLGNTREIMKGRVAGYRIHYMLEGDGPSPFETEPDPVKNNIMVKDVYGQTDHALLIGLEPYSGYFVRVQVFNTAGAGPKGEWRWGEVSNRPLSQYPTHVKVYPNTEQSIRVVWRGVSILPEEESLQGYIIRVWKVQDDIRTATDMRTEKETEAILNGLQKHTVYELRILGYSVAGDGAISESVYFTVLGGNIPIDPSTSQICYMDQDSSTCGADYNRVNIILMCAIMLVSIVLLHH